MSVTLSIYFWTRGRKKRIVSPLPVSDTNHKPTTKMNNIEISTAAKNAWDSKMDRASFLQTLLPMDRNFGALQFDRMKRLSECEPPTAEDIEASAKDIAEITAFFRVARETSMPYEHEKFIGRVLTGRVLSAGEQRIADQIRNAATPNDEDWAAAREHAANNITSDERFLKDRLGK